MTPASDPSETAAAICTSHGNDPALLIEILHDLQDSLGYVPEAALPTIAKCLNIARAEVHGVMSFYHDFRSAPVEGALVKLCLAEACQSMGARKLAGSLKDIPGLVVQPVYCLGNCALAPAAMVGGRLLGRVTAEQLALEAGGADT